MRARAVREGSVGLLILIGVGLFGGLVLWLRGLNPGNRNYDMRVIFQDTVGMQVGTAVRYRGVPVGRVVDIMPSSNQVEVRLEITQSDLRIPEENLRIAANQSGFIGETTIDITPMAELTEAEQAMSPTAADCESGVIVCDGETLVGTTGVSYESLLTSAETLASTLADPELINSLKETLENTTDFTDAATQLTRELTTLTLTAQEEVEPLSDSVQQATTSAAAAAEAIQLTATDVRTLLDANRVNITATLSNISQSTTRLSGILDNLATELEDPQLLAELRALSANAAEASEYFRDAAIDISTLTGSINQPENVLLIQQTLESARDVFQGAQKVLSDVDELTGDPRVRDNIRNLIYGLSDLLSNAEILEHQARLAIALAPLEQRVVPTAPTTPAITLPRADYQALQNQLAGLAATQPEPPAPVQ
ncbi:MAG: MCE family protein [Leptolyngbya sp. SIOISBB]|nr:MCE family protein [Leptolyngbya sp. SIOISBB]